MMDSIGWGVVLMLLGDFRNEITDNTYMLNHLRLNLIMLAVIFMAVLSCCFLTRYNDSLKRGKKKLMVIKLISLHLLLPLFILLFVPVFFATPLWVARAFVPDVFITVIISVALLFAGGLVKSVILFKHIKHNK